MLLGVLPLQSSRHAEFLHNEVPGITIPDGVRARLRDAGDRAADVGLDLALELVRSAAPLVAGTYIMPSFGRYEQCAELVRRIRADVPAAARGSRSPAGPEPGSASLGGRAAVPATLRAWVQSRRWKSSSSS